MSPLADSEFRMLLVAVGALLLAATLIGRLLRRLLRAPQHQSSVINLNQRIDAWWAMAAVLALAILLGPTGSILLFFVVSFLALREFITLTPTVRADHRALLWMFFVVTPLHYLLIAIDWYGLFAVFIPVYAYILLPTRAVLAGETRDFLARMAKVQWGLMVAVYFLSHVPAILTLDIPGYEGENFKLLLFLTIVVQCSDVFQYVCGKLFGRRPVAPDVSPNKTLEGLVGGIALATAIGGALWWLTPFSPWEAVLMSLLICLLGFAGGLVMSAIKRDRGVKDYGAILPGHGGMLDRVDSLCFAAPIFFHLVRYLHTP